MFSITERSEILCHADYNIPAMPSMQARSAFSNGHQSNGQHRGPGLDEESLYPASPSSVGFAEESVRDWSHPDINAQMPATAESMPAFEEKLRLRRLHSRTRSQGLSIGGDDLHSAASTPFFTPRLSQLLGPGLLLELACDWYTLHHGFNQASAERWPFQR